MDGVYVCRRDAAKTIAICCSEDWLFLFSACGSATWLEADERSEVARRESMVAKVNARCPWIGCCGQLSQLPNRELRTPHSACATSGAAAKKMDLLIIQL
jgi:hypothetical protein